MSIDISFDRKLAEAAGAISHAEVKTDRTGNYTERWVTLPDGSNIADYGDNDTIITYGNHWGNNRSLVIPFLQSNNIPWREF